MVGADRVAIAADMGTRPMGARCCCTESHRGSAESHREKKREGWWVLTGGVIVTDMRIRPRGARSGGEM